MTGVLNSAASRVPLWREGTISPAGRVTTEAPCSERIWPQIKTVRYFSPLKSLSFWIFLLAQPPPSAQEHAGGKYLQGIAVQFPARVPFPPPACIQVKYPRRSKKAGVAANIVSAGYFPMV